ncbi:MAG: hypothetical protein ABJD24_18730 [Acidimicrobiales bacterium]
MSPKKSLAMFGVVALLTAGAATTATASPQHSGPESIVFRARLKSLNSSGAHGVARLRLTGDVLRIRIDATGLLPDSVHAQHIHGIGNSECPPPSAAGADGILSTADGLPFYGPIVTSLTTHGDTSAAAGLTIELMPVADANGNIHYRRTITLPHDVASNLGAFQIVQHGVDFNHSGAYDFGAGPSELDPALPQEATAPADCGTIDPALQHNDDSGHDRGDSDSEHNDD